MSKLTNDLIQHGYLKTDIIIDAFSEIDREEFVPQELVGSAHANVALPIGYGQTISQPMTVAIMMELLDPRRGHKILDLGSGSGWTTTLLSYIVGKTGRVIAIERKKELMEFGKNNTDKYGFVKKGITSFYCQDGTKGMPSEAPFDRILVSAAAECVPNALKDQLAFGGKMVIPIGNSLWLLEKKSERDFDKKEYAGFSFVPLIEGEEK